MRATRQLALSAVVTTAAALMTPVAALAAEPRPAAPHGVREVSATPTSFTVTSDRAANAKRYVVLASRVKSDIFFPNLRKSRPHRVTAHSSTPTVTLRGLSYTTRPYYYRMQTRNGHRTALSDIKFGYVAPAAPADASVVTPADGSGLALTWADEPSKGFTIEQSAKPSMANHTTYHVDGNATQFTPPDLHTGTSYYFRVRSDNGAASSVWSPVLSQTFSGSVANLKVMTWNVLHEQFDGTKENGNTIAPWKSKRLPVVASMIKDADPDLIVINEANDWDGPRPRRQIDTLAAKLKGTYALSDADFTTDSWHPRVGNYIFYRRNMIRPLYTQQNGKAHFWTIAFHRDNGNMAMYQAYEDVATGAKFLMVAVHLLHGQANKKIDAQRRTEVQHLLNRVRELRQQPEYADLPVLFGGDFNSFAGPNPDLYDSPGDLMRSFHATDSLMAAQTRTNTQYGSVNDYTRTPSDSGRIIDHFYGTAGIGFRWWKQDMHLVHGKWPGAIPSDHNPILAGISVQNGGGTTTARNLASSAQSRPNRGARPVHVPAVARAVNTAHPDRYVGHGTPGSCTSAAFVRAVARGGVIGFRCGSQPATITLHRTAKIVNTSKRVVLDGQNKITISGDDKHRILYLDTCDQRQQWTTSHCDDQAHPQLVVQNLRLVHGNSTGADFDGGGGGAIFDRGGRLKIVNSTFAHNRCEHTGPDIGGAAVRALSQYHGKPVYVVHSTFAHNTSSNGAGLSSIGVSWAVYNSTFEHNRAIGHGANPARKHTPGGGSGAAIYTDGNTYRLTIKGTVMTHNTANEGGGAVFYVSNDRTGTLSIDWSTLRDNPSKKFETQPGIYFLGKTKQPSIRHTIDK